MHEIAREARIRMAQEDKPWFQFHADLELISFNGKEGIGEPGHANGSTV